MPFPHRLIASGVLGGSGPTWVTPTDIPASEAAALKSLYDLTNGASWTNKTNWGKTLTAANWYGLTLSGGKVIYIDLHLNNLVGNAAAWTPQSFTTLQRLYLYENALLTGPMTGWTIPATLVYWRTYTTALTSVPSMASAVAMKGMRFDGCSWTQANVDALLLAIYTRWATGALTAPAPSINVSGTNAAPSGAYADEDPPTTGLGACFEICTDPEETEYATWTATVTGSGPYP